jgi:hypothetical protein
MILPPEAKSLFSNNSGQPRRIIPKIYRHADVLDVQALNMNWMCGSTGSRSNIFETLSVDARHRVSAPKYMFSPDLFVASRSRYTLLVRDLLNELTIRKRGLRFDR